MRIFVPKDSWFTPSRNQSKRQKKLLRKQQRREFRNVANRYIGLSKKRDKQIKFKTLIGNLLPYVPGMKRGFYNTREWLETRFRILARDGVKCTLCGAKRSSGIPMHVDHIKPRSQYPELELDPENLQVLCEVCNIGKGTKVWDNRTCT